MPDAIGAESPESSAGSEVGGVVSARVHLARPGLWPVCGARVEDKRRRSGYVRDVTCPECLRRRMEF